MQNKFKTTDFDTALILFGARRVFMGTDWPQSESRAYFLFEDKDACEVTIRKHRMQQLKLDSHLVLNGLRELKNSLFR